jgi:hypothetical protein
VRRARRCRGGAGAEVPGAEVPGISSKKCRSLSVYKGVWEDASATYLRATWSR